jgi:uncharacterized Zn-finger protein
MSFTCDKCNKNFVSKFTLNRHIKENIHCLNTENKISSKNGCNYCNKQYASERTLQQHYSVCRKKIDDEIKEKEIQNENIIAELNKKITIMEKEIIELKMTIVELNIEKNIYKDDHESIKKLAMQPKTTTK